MANHPDHSTPNSAGTDDTCTDSAEEAAQADRFTDALLSNTSHELRTPLTAILGFTAVLQEELPERFKEFLDPIEHNGQRLLHTLNALLDLARLRAGMVEVNPEPLDVTDLVAHIVQGFAAQAEQKGLYLHLVPSPQPIRATTDPHLLQRILNHLVDNAVKFTGKEGTVTVTVARRDDQVHIHVRDTGVGIDESFLPHVFEEFKQESTGLARSHEGNGLGLSITARLVALMDGQISVQSQKGSGSIFSVSFPILAARNGTTCGNGNGSAFSHRS